MGVFNWQINIFYSILFYSILFYSILFYSILFTLQTVIYFHNRHKSSATVTCFFRRFVSPEKKSFICKVVTTIETNEAVTSSDFLGGRGGTEREGEEDWNPTSTSLTFNHRLWHAFLAFTLVLVHYKSLSSVLQTVKSIYHRWAVKSQVSTASPVSNP